MLIVIFLSLLAPLSIYFGLIIQESTALTFLLFYGGVCLVIPIVDLKFIRKLPTKTVFQTLGFQNLRKTILPSLILGFSYLMFIVLFFHVLQDHVLNVEETRATLHAWDFNREYVTLLLFLMIFANSIVEELYWRGYIFFRFQEKVKPGKVILLTSLFYASYHLITTINLFSLLYGLIFSTVIFGIGLFWGYLRQKYDSIYVVMISHLMADLGIMLVYLRYIY